MTPEEIKTIGHAFFDGKVLKFRPWEVDRRDGNAWVAWVDWPETYCPDFDIQPEWRIKPDEPKKVKFFGWLGTSGELRQVRANESWPNQHGLIRIPELDREITLPEGE